MCHLPWRDPVWDKISNRKHRRASRQQWQRSITVAWTGQPDEASQFDPNLTDAEIETMQIESVNSDPEYVVGTPIRSECHKRTFFRDMQRIIGASAGEKTQFIYVEYVNSGQVHGWPITEDQLKRKLKK